MNQGGRPRKVRSKPTAGGDVGGVDARKHRELLRIAEQYGVDPEDFPERAGELMQRLNKAYNSYCATEAALAQQVGVADELFDLDTLLTRARRVLVLLQHRIDLEDAKACVPAAAALAESLQRFPNLVNAKISEMPGRPQFLEARTLLRINVLRIRAWDRFRSDLIHHLEVLIDACERVEPPAGFTKRPRQARDMFETELKQIYTECVHPTRREIWPSAPESKAAFANKVMRALGVKFEVKGVSG